MSLLLKAFFFLINSPECETVQWAWPKVVCSQLLWRLYFLLKVCVTFVSYSSFSLCSFDVRPLELLLDLASRVSPPRVSGCACFALRRANLRGFEFIFFHLSTFITKNNNNNNNNNKVEKLTRFLAFTPFLLQSSFRLHHGAQLVRTRCWGQAHRFPRSRMAG